VDGGGVEGVIKTDEGGQGGKGQRSQFLVGRL